MSVVGKATALTKAAFIRASGSDNGCMCRIRMSFDPALRQASLLIHFHAELADIGDNPHWLILLVRPAIVRTCMLAPESDDKLISPSLLRYVPSNSVSSAADVLTLTLTLASHGAVLFPKGLRSVHPTDRSNANFQAFMAVCQTPTIVIHFAKAQFGSKAPNRANEAELLQRFVDCMQTALKAEHVDLDRQDSGRGLQEGTPVVFHLETSLSDRYDGGDPSLARAHGKRIRRASSSQSDSLVKRTHLYTSPPPYSPTEINTPTPIPTVQSTASTGFGNIAHSKTPRNVSSRPPPRYVQSVPSSSQLDSQSSLLANMLSIVPEDVLCNAIIKSGHARLLRPSFAPRYKASVLSKHTHDDTQSTDGGSSDTRSKQSTDARLDPIVRRVFTSMVETRLQVLVDASLPSLTQNAIEEVMSEFQERINEGCEAAEMAIQEKVEDADLDVKMARDDGIKEIEELVEESLRKIVEESEVFDFRAETELENLRSYFAKFAQDFLHEQWSSKRVRIIKNRRISI